MCSYSVDVHVHAWVPALSARHLCAEHWPREHSISRNAICILTTHTHTHIYLSISISIYMFEPRPHPSTCLGPSAVPRHLLSIFLSISISISISISRYIDIYTYARTLSTSMYISRSQRCPLAIFCLSFYSSIYLSISISLSRYIWIYLSKCVLNSSTSMYMSS